MHTRTHKKHTTRGPQEGSEGKFITGTVAPCFFGAKASTKLSQSWLAEPHWAQSWVLCGTQCCAQKLSENSKRSLCGEGSQSLPTQSLLSLWGMVSALHLQWNSSLDSRHKDTHAWFWFTPLLTYFSLLLWLRSRAIRQTICSVSRQLLLLLLLLKLLFLLL